MSETLTDTDNTTLHNYQPSVRGEKKNMQELQLKTVHQLYAFSICMDSKRLGGK